MAFKEYFKLNSFIFLLRFGILFRISFFLFFVAFFGIRVFWIRTNFFFWIRIAWIWISTTFATRIAAITTVTTRFFVLFKHCLQLLFCLQFLHFVRLLSQMFTQFLCECTQTNWDEEVYCETGIPWMVFRE